MTTPKAWMKALMTYNQSRPYAEEVRDRRANAYAANVRYPSVTQRRPVLPLVQPHNNHNDAGAGARASGPHKHQG